MESYYVHSLVLSCTKIWPSAGDHLRRAFRPDSFGLVFSPTLDSLVILSGEPYQPLSIFSGVLSFFDLHLSVSRLLIVVGLHFLLYVLVNSILQNVGAYPDSIDIDALLKVFAPVFFSFLTVYSP